MSMLMTKKRVVKYSVQSLPTLFVQTLNNMCLDAEMVSLYKHFVLSIRILFVKVLEGGL